MIGLLKVDRLIEQLADELLPSLGIFLDALGQRISHLSAELLIAPGAARTAQNGEFTGQAALPEQLEQGRHELAVGEITAGPEDHQTLGRDHAFLAQSDPQGVGGCGEHGAHWCLTLV